MYQNHFGFKERPFQLVPNPAYLFLSRSHEEAMAHLTYATTNGDGFVAITGEVGTGKTTLCRAFIESLDDRCEVAYIFNPKLTAFELLQVICDEFGIATSHHGTTKDLVDSLNRFLLAKKADGKQVMLIIDEAQNLSQEVLEQIRLLSNLETNTEKLLQIVLVGQPEMDNVLGTYELRQLSQRITLNCHICPLTYQETVQYIRHRIRLAARNEGVYFSMPAFRKIYNFSKGIPRLIHIVCDRVLLTAYGMNRHRITGGIVNTAIRELSTRGDVSRLRIIERRRTLLLLSVICLILILLFAVNPLNFGTTPVIKSMKRFKIPPAPATLDPEAPSNDVTGREPPAPERLETPGFTSEIALEPFETNEMSPDSIAAPVAEIQTSPLVALLTGMDAAVSKNKALAGALSLWGVAQPIKAYTDKELIDPKTYFVLSAMENGFRVHGMQSGLTRVLKLNLPAIFGFYLPGRSDPYFLTLSQMDNETLTFLTGAEGGRLEVSAKDIETLWLGLVYIPWINFYDYNGTTPLSGTEDDILKLKQLLETIGYKDLAPGAVYDAKTEAAVKEIQRRYAIPMDGFVGPLTKIALYNEQPGLNIPHIRVSGATEQATEPMVAP